MVEATSVAEMSGKVRDASRMSESVLNLKRNPNNNNKERGKHTQVCCSGDFRRQSIKNRRETTRNYARYLLHTRKNNKSIKSRRNSSSSFTRPSLATAVSILVASLVLTSINDGAADAKLMSSKLPDLASGTNDEPIVATAGQDAYISCVANNLQNYTIIWRFSNDAHAPGLAADDSSASKMVSSSPGDSAAPASGKLEDADAGATILTAGRQRVTSDERFTVIRSHNTWLLKITNVKLSDTGTYVCQTNSEPRVRALRILSVVKQARGDSNSKLDWRPPLELTPEDETLLTRGQHLQVDYNFTECCKQEYVYPKCHKLCSIQQLASKYHTLNIVHECYNALPSITRCMVAGRNVVSCCERQHVPARCHSMCGKSADAAMSVSIQDQSYCKDYSASIMSCVAEGINSLPGQPEYVIVEAISSTSLKVSWQRVTDEAELRKLDGWIINLTKLSSFEDTISSATPITSSDPKQVVVAQKPQQQTAGNESGQQATLKTLANLSALDVRQNSSLAAMTRLLAAASNATVSLKLEKHLSEFSIDNLKPYTVYQIQMFAFNKEGRSQLSDPIRALTLAPENDLQAERQRKPDSDSDSDSASADSDELVEPNLPDTRKCCESRGVTLRKCVDVLCDPIEADRATIEDLMICAPWSNITFSCLSSRVDHSECCKARGVTPFCLSMCSGEMKRLDYRHFRCLTHMSTYTNCILESHDVLPSAPQNFTVGPITSSWAVLNWRSPKRRAKTLQGYRIFWRKLESPASGPVQNSDDSPGGTTSTTSALSALSNPTPSAGNSALASLSGSAPLNDELYYTSGEAATNPYLLDALQPDTVYETFVVAVNKFGQSKSSARFHFQTLADLSHLGRDKTRDQDTGSDLESRLPLHGKVAPESQESQMSFYNETSCCLSSGVPSSCRQLCNYDLKVSDGYDLITSCASQMPAIMRCLAGNRNNVPCCRTRGVSDQCLNVCAGLTEHSPLMVASQCGSDFGKILQCLDEGSKQIPSAPLDLHATEVLSTRVKLAWRPANEDKLRSDVEYHVRFQQLQSSSTSSSGSASNSDSYSDSDSRADSETTPATTDLSALIAVVPLHPLEHNRIVTTNKTELTLEKLSPGARYSLYVTAENSYGISLPSLVLVLELPKRDSNATEEHKRAATLGPPHALEILRADTESITLKWSPPLYMENEAQLRYRVFYKLLGPVKSVASDESVSSPQLQSNGPGDTQQVQGNWSALETGSTSIPLRGLSYYSQYAITVQAFTRNKRGHMSELLLASTAKPIPPSINPPFIINAPIEGNNITIMCVALGQPTPQISMFINGLLVQKRTQPYIVYHLINLSRDPLTITCFASNGRGRDYASVQSRTEVSVKFAPRATATTRLVRANSQSIARLSCLIQGNPQPSVVWTFVSANLQASKPPASVILPNERVTTLVANQFDSPSAWTHTLSIRNTSLADAGSYQCRAVNALNESSSTLELSVAPAKVTLQSLTNPTTGKLSEPLLEASSDLAECCKSQNVSSKCLPVCSSDGLDIEQAFKIPECQGNLDKLMFCAADGSDHRTCCRQRQVPFSCLRWCSGSKLYSIPAICFLSSAMDINQCFQEGRTLLPGPPRNLRAFLAADSIHASQDTEMVTASPMTMTVSMMSTMPATMQLPSDTPAPPTNSSLSGGNMASIAMGLGDSIATVASPPETNSSASTTPTTPTRPAPAQPIEPIIIEWDAPVKNAQLVLFYRIFWRPVKSRQLSRLVTNQTWIKLSDFDASKEYEFVVKAANLHGSSVYSDPLTVKPAEIVANGGSSGLSSASGWFADLGVPNRDSLIGRLIMTVTYATCFMFSILVIVLFLEKRGYLQQFASSKSNNSRISFANPSYANDSAASGQPADDDPFASGSSPTSEPIELTSDARSLSRGSSEGRGSGSGSHSSASNQMRFETITWAQSSAGNAATQLGEPLELPPIHIDLNSTSSSATNNNISNPNYRS